MNTLSFICYIALFVASSSDEEGNGTPEERIYEEVDAIYHNPRLLYTSRKEQSGKQNGRDESPHYKTPRSIMALPFSYLSELPTNPYNSMKEKRKTLSHIESRHISPKPLVNLNIKFSQNISKSRVSQERPLDSNNGKLGLHEKTNESCGKPHKKHQIEIYLLGKINALNGTENTDIVEKKNIENKDSILRENIPTPATGSEQSNLNSLHAIEAQYTQYVDLCKKFAILKNQFDNFGDLLSTQLNDLAIQKTALSNKVSSYEEKPIKISDGAMWKQRNRKQTRSFNVLDAKLKETFSEDTDDHCYINYTGDKITVGKSSSFKDLKAKTIDDIVRSSTLKIRNPPFKPIFFDKPPKEELVVPDVYKCEKSEKQNTCKKIEKRNTCEKIKKENPCEKKGKGFKNLFSKKKQKPYNKK
ncbi:hypothetical protein SLOPH_1046 [Spraguea lophii 42_110]|uniref:Uncharacterized protein n=1 Tax=Spraguea lophii (strain 42_110) TaxID=1358809 RepID=S7W778_SPRLO|nr:hypothetical protein SLOPH_1046 [Spraguea lophii 42_110]